MKYILFSPEGKLSIHVRTVREALWDGTMEYSYDNKEWKEWNGEQIINNTIYMRGINNTVVNRGESWIINGKNVKCQGNIEALLDYRLIMYNIHPKMKPQCFFCLFEFNDSLIEIPQLSAPKLAKDCYFLMCNHCIALTTPPIFPNFQIAKEAIVNQKMFFNCYLKQININNKLYDINVLKLL